MATKKTIKGTREKSKENLKKLEEGYPLKDRKTGKVVVRRGKPRTGKVVDDRKYQNDKLKRDL